MESKALLKNITRGGIIAAAYTVVTLILYPIAFGPIQCRLSEALTILPVFTPSAIWGLTLGCAISNLIAVISGNAIAGVWDILFGALATLAAALLSRSVRKVTVKGFPLLATVFPVVINALVIGAELTFAALGKIEPALFAYNAACVFAGQAIACVLGGLLLFTAVKKTRLFELNI